MDVLVKESLKRLNEAVSNINWEILEEVRKTHVWHDINDSREIDREIHKSLLAVDVMKSALKSVR